MQILPSAMKIAGVRRESSICICSAAIALARLQTTMSGGVISVSVIRPFAENTLCRLDWPAAQMRFAYCALGEGTPHAEQQTHSARLAQTAALK